MARTVKPPEFEQALAELETLVAHLERGDLPLDEALKSFERGIALTRHCQASLQAAQAKVEILMKRGGEAVVEPFEESAEDTDAQSAAGTAPAGE